MPYFLELRGFLLTFVTKKRQKGVFNIQKYPDRGIFLMKKKLLLTRSNKSFSSAYQKIRIYLTKNQKPMMKDQIPLFIPLGNFSDHCNSLDRKKLVPIIELVHEMELKFYKAEKLLGTQDLSELSLRTLGLSGIHVRLLDAILKLRLVPLFDWMAWKSEAERYYKDASNLYELDTVTLGKVMTVLLRSQTLYGPEFLESKIKDRFVLNLLKAILHSVDGINSWNYSEILD
ncbi:hypothetical protein SAMN05192553_105213 [Cyclobacterium xiamenense]|uniref:Uncharacterized protein n=2 Tax=Cyclobacterium xiamenense TaxID=1297121 RepID=A0A1H7A843_9BACT|nr:hypothetical protein SAMN05192553_105213 [Cyclobacterium xiamenense]